MNGDIMYQDLVYITSSVYICEGKGQFMDTTKSN